MITGGSNAGILAARRNGDVLIADEPTRVELRWSYLPSADGEAIDVAWSASIACVDSPADRALLAERFLGGEATLLPVGRVATDLSMAMATALRSAIVDESADALLDGSVEKKITAAIESAARAAAFAAGLAILPPFACSISCPSRESARRLSESRERLARIAENDDARARSMADLSRALIESSGDPARAARAVAAVRLADPLDLLRVTALVETSWAATSPSLWVAAGLKLARVEIGDAKIDSSNTTFLGDALGPLRSICAVRIDGEDVLLIGAREGVHLVTADGGVRVRQTFGHHTGSEFGFNSACFLGADRRIVATHSAIGIVSWSLDDPASPPRVEAKVDRARSAIAVEADRIVLLVDGRMATVSPGGSVELFAGNSRLMSVDVDGRDGVRRRKLIREDSVGSGEARYTASVAIEDEIDVAGVPRSVRPLVAGGLEMVDVASTSRLPIGPPSIAARSVVARPGFVAAVSVDRTRVSVIDLGRPDVTLAEINSSIALGSRVADICFA